VFAPTPQENDWEKRLSYRGDKGLKREKKRDGTAEAKKIRYKNIFFPRLKTS